MPGGYDGSIRIDTRVDGKGFNAGIRNIGGSLKGILTALMGVAAAVGLAFSIGTVINFGKSAVDAASELAAAMTGLQSVVNGMGMSYSNAKAFIADFTKDGLVPATNAITAYKNLALRGYDTSQIEQTMLALKDAAAFGRQSSLSMGYAVQSASEGLKNENSILVDNAGVTKNVSMMWKEYAESIGTTVDALTQEQKIQAEVNGILQETRFQAGDAAKLSDQYAGKVAALGVSFLNFKVAVGNVIIPVIAKILPYIKAAIDALTIFFNRLATIMSLLFGVQIGGTVEGLEGVADSTEAAADAQNDLADGTKAAGKAAKGALAAFDELNVLQRSDGSGAGGKTGGGGGGGGQPLIDPEPTDSALEQLRAKVEAFKQSLMALLEPAIAAFDRLKKALEPLGQTIWGGLKWAWDNILVPFGTWVLAEAVPAFLDLLAASATLLNEALIALQPLGIWLWENFLKPLGEWAGGVIIDSLKWLTERLKDLSQWIKDNPEKFQVIIIILGVFALTLLAVAGIVLIVIGVISVVTSIVGAFGAAIAFVAATPAVLIMVAIAAIIGIILSLIGIIAWFIQRWDALKAKAVEVWEKIKDKWKDAGAWFNKEVVTPIKEAFETTLDGIQEKWNTIFNGIQDLVKNTVNTIIDLLNGMNNAIASGINTVITSLNAIKVTIPDWVPIYGGKSWGMNLPKVTVTQIPRLASGAVIPPNSEYLAILGDQRHGRNIETPEALMRQIVREEIEGMGGDLVVNMPVYLDGEKIYENQKRVQKRRGTSLITSGVTA